MLFSYRAWDNREFDIKSGELSAWKMLGEDIGDLTR